MLVTTVGKSIKIDWIETCLTELLAVVGLFPVLIVADSAVLDAEVSELILWDETIAVQINFWKDP